MKRVIFLGLIFSLLLACATVPPGQAPEIRGALDDLMERWVTALREENIDALMSTYWPEAEMVIVQFDGHEQHLRGHNAIERYQLEGFQQIDMRRELHFGEPEREFRGDSAAYHIFVEAPGVQLVNHFELVHREGRWGIIHQVIEPLRPEHAEGPGLPVISEFQAWADFNQNGRLEPSEMEELMHAIDRLVHEPHRVETPVDELFDLNRDGHIEPPEMNRARNILFEEQLRRLYQYDRDLAPFFDLNEDGWIEYWEAGSIFDLIFFDEIQPPIHERMDTNRDGRIDDREKDEYIGRVLNTIAMLPLRPEDIDQYTWISKEVFVAWADVNHNRELDPPEINDLGSRSLGLVHEPLPVHSPLGDYFDRNRDGHIGPAEMERARQTIFEDQLDRLYEVEPELVEFLDLNWNRRIDEDERSMLREFFYREPWWSERPVSSPLEEKLDHNRDGQLDGGEQSSFRVRLLGNLTVAWIHTPEEERGPEAGWPVRSPLDELADLNRNGLIETEEEHQMMESLRGPHPVESVFDERIDFNRNDEVEAFEIMRARRAGEEMVMAEEEGVYAVQTLIDEHLDLNNDRRIDEGEIGRVLEFLKGAVDTVERRSKLYGLTDIDGNGDISEEELVKSLDLYLLPHPFNPDEPLDRELDRNRDGFIDPAEIGIAAGVSASGPIPNFIERLERLQWEVVRKPEPAEEEVKEETKTHFESEFYKKIGQIQDKKLAVVGITVRAKNVDEDTAGGVMVFIENAFVNIGKVRVVDRQNITKIVKEYEFQQSDLTDESTAVEIGKLAGADIIVIGSINYVGKKYYLNVKLINVETAEIFGSSISDAEDASEFYDMANDAVYKLF